MASNRKADSLLKGKKKILDLEMGLSYRGQGSRETESGAM